MSICRRICGSIGRVYVDPGVRESSMARRVLSRLPDVPVFEAGDDPVPGDGAGHTLYLKEYKGDFLRFCPGTRYYNCCGYRIAHIGENCPLSCSYCILQAYFQDRVLKVWANNEDFFSALDKAFGADPNRRFRVGTGEFTDSLALEPLTGYGGELVEFLNRHPNVCLELKSKFVDLTWMERAARSDRVLPAWSMNAPEIVATQEHGASTLEERLAAAPDLRRGRVQGLPPFRPHHPFPRMGEGATPGPWR